MFLWKYNIKYILVHAISYSLVIISILLQKVCNFEIKKTTLKHELDDKTDNVELSTATDLPAIERQNKTDNVELATTTDLPAIERHNR